LIVKVILAIFTRASAQQRSTEYGCHCTDALCTSWLELECNRDLTSNTNDTLQMPGASKELKWILKDSARRERFSKQKTSTNLARKQNDIDKLLADLQFGVNVNIALANLACS
jgi:hypothetical protein